MADFGLASVQDSQVALSSVSSGRASGTPRWQAPELLDPQSTDLEGEGCNSMASDMYSFGCVCYEASLPVTWDMSFRDSYSSRSQIYSGVIPFHEITNDFRVILAVTRGDRPSRPPVELRKIRGNLDSEIWEVIKKCLMQSPRQRPTANQIIIVLRDISGKQPDFEGEATSHPSAVGIGISAITLDDYEVRSSSGDLVCMLTVLTG